MREGIVDEKELEALEASADQEIIEATDRALASEPAPKESVLRWVYSPDIDPTSRAFEAEPRTHVRAIVR